MSEPTHPRGEHTAHTAENQVSENLATAAAPAQVVLSLGGMTCAACAARIEKQLNRVAGVTATVNYATERAHAWVAPGVAPETLIDTVEQAGYQASLQPTEVQSLQVLSRRVIATALLAVPVVLISMLPALQFDYWQWVIAALTLPIVTWAAWPMHRAAWRNLRHGTASMDTLVSVGITAAYLWSWVSLIWGHAGMVGMTHSFSLRLEQSDGLGNIYFEVTAGVTLFVLAGRLIEARAKRDSGAALRALSASAASEVSVLREGIEHRISPAQLQTGELFVVRPGEKIAADGVVMSGTSAVDAALITGESLPVEVAPQSQVTGGTINVSGLLTVQATQVGAHTQLAQMVRLVEHAQTGKARVQRLTDRVSAVFVPVVLLISALTLVIWLISGFGVSGAISAAVAVLIIACPCALGLAVPTALLVGTGRGAQLGVLITGPDVLEASRAVDTVVLDKTGTVTTGEMRVHAIHTEAGVSTETLLTLAGAVEFASEHPLGRAIVAAALQQGGRQAPELPAVTDFLNVPGQGVVGVVGTARVIAGKPELLRAEGIALSSTAEQSGDHTTVWVASNGVLQGRLEIADRVKASSSAAIRDLIGMGFRVELLSGDTSQVTARVAQEVGVARWTAGVSPAGKAEHISALQAEGRTVAMVGDGVNDAVALAQADLGIAMSSGTGAAMAAADITLLRDDVRGVATALHLSRRTMRVIRQNLWWAFGYNVAAIPLAACGLLHPMLAGAAMALSSLCVVGNSLRLRWVRPREVATK